MELRLGTKGPLDIGASFSTVIVLVADPFIELGTAISLGTDASPVVQQQDPSSVQHNGPSSYPDDSTVLESSSLTVPGDFNVYQDLLKRMTATLGIQVEFLQESIRT